MRTMLILSSIALLIHASGAVAQEPDIRGVYPNEVFDEIVVVGTTRCGSWPIEHQRLRGCVYAELEKKDFPMVLQARQDFLSDCLICSASRCTMKSWPEDWIKEKRFCKRVFRTPTRVPRFMNPDVRVKPLRVTYTFSISTEGKVQSIDLISFDGDIEEAELLRLIRNGAAKTRFEPIIVFDMAYELIGLRDSFILDDL